MPRLFTPSLAKKYEELYEQNGVKFVKVSSTNPLTSFVCLDFSYYIMLNVYIYGNQGALIDKLDAGSDGRVSSAILKDGSVVEADTVTIFVFSTCSYAAVPNPKP
jgi:monodehydroascorbate reductase (NADH)